MKVDFNISVKQVTFLFCLILASYQHQNIKNNPEKEDSLETGFKNPPQEAKPRTWYHVNSDNMSKAGFTKDLKAIKDAGIGGVLVFNVSMGLPEGDVTYNSQEHRDILTHAAKECEILGLSFGVHNCDGWTSSGRAMGNPRKCHESCC